MSNGRDPTLAARALLAATEALAQVLARETDALAAHDGITARTLLAEKAAAISDYERAVAALGEAAGTPGRIDHALAQALKSAGQRLRAASDGNRRRLEIARAGQRRLVELIVDAAKTVTAGPGTYARSGSIARPAVRRAPPPPALSLNLAF